VAFIKQIDEQGGDRAEATRAALTYLQRRARSEHETRAKLESKGYSAEIITQVLSRLREASLINDARFAKDWVQARSRKALGSRHIRKELRAMGVADVISNAALASLAEPDDPLDEDSPQSYAIAYARRCLRKLAGKPDDVIKHKLIQSLMRRGFSYDDAKSAASQAIERDGMD
jgi:regulatory protein